MTTPVTNQKVSASCATTRTWQQMGANPQPKIPEIEIPVIRMSRRLSLGLLLSAAAVLTPFKAQAGTLTFYIFDDPSTGNAKVVAKGSIDGASSSTNSFSCTNAGNFEINKTTSIISFCGGPNAAATYKIYGTNTSNFPGASFQGSMSLGSLSGLSFAFDSDGEYLALGDTFTGGNVDASISFSQSLANAGVTSSNGLIGTFSLTSGDTVEVRYEAPPTSSTPSPLPLMGGVLAFQTSRSLRKRISTGRPQTFSL